MQNKTSVYVWVGIGVAVVISLLALSIARSSASPDSSGNVGAAVNGGNVTNFDAVQTINGYWVGNNRIANASGIFASSIAQFDGGILHSYSTATSSTGTAATLALSDLVGYDTVIVTPNTGDLTYTFPASSTASTWLPAAGDTQNTCFYNATTTSGIEVKFTAGTGITLQYASTTAGTAGSFVNQPTIGPRSLGCFTFVRQDSNSAAFDITAAFVRYIDAD